jgi:DNA polymerase bacteriophage-type
MPTLHRDFETRSCANLKVAGAHRYAAAHSTEVMCCAYAVDDGPVRLWMPGDPAPPEIIAAATDPDWLACAHNDAFETAIETSIMAPRYGWPAIPLERHRCSMAMALTAGLPAGLGDVARVLELSNQKDAAGEALMLRMCKPRHPRKGEDPAAGPYWFEDPERMNRLFDYCRADVECERELFQRLDPLPPSEQNLWELHCAINARGFPVDRKLAIAAQKIADAAVPAIDSELEQLTGGAVDRVSQVARLLAWLQGQGCKLESLDRETIELHLQNGAAPAVRRALELRLDGAQAASKKIVALLDRAGADNRVRGAFKFHGAATGRWSGSGFQPQNLKKPQVDDLEAAIAAVATGDFAAVAHYPRPLSIIGDCTRPMIAAARGHVLIGADFSSIESRALAWAATEDWKLDSYRRFDETQDPELEPYRVTAAKLFRTTPAAVTDEQRASGKVCDLAFGFQGGARAFKAFSSAFTDDEIEQFKKDWRAAHPMIQRLWHDLNRAAVDAVYNRGKVIKCGPVAFKAHTEYLQLKLPSGRKISYPLPRLAQGEYGPGIIFADNSKGFTDHRAYGGLLAENVASGIARDILAEAMIRLELAGYPIVLHCHDELVAEVPIGFGSTADFTAPMTQVPGWALGLPIAAVAWTGPRYTK